MTEIETHLFGHSSNNYLLNYLCVADIKATNLVNKRLNWVKLRPVIIIYSLNY